MKGEGDINNPLAAERRGLGTSGGRCQLSSDSAGAAPSVTKQPDF
jgi:hypothetical protein